MTKGDAHQVPGAGSQALEAGLAGESLVEPVCAPIPSGYFLMGSDRGQDEEKPVHRVWVDAFEMAVLQVRNRDYRVFLESSGLRVPKHWNDPDLNHPDQPVVAVSWFDAVKYCEWLSTGSGRRYRLPTEAEWERAARGGREGLVYPWGDEPPSEWPDYVTRWGGEVRGPLLVGPGGGSTTNPYGVYNISENVHEWCADWFGRDYYAQSPEGNPRGPETGDRRASRGGSWRHQIKVSRCSARSSIPP